MSGCIAFAKVSGTSKVESELLPQMWEQVRYLLRTYVRLQEDYVVCWSTGLRASEACKACEGM